MRFQWKPWFSVMCFGSHRGFAFESTARSSAGGFTVLDQAGTLHQSTGLNTDGFEPPSANGTRDAGYDRLRRSQTNQSGGMMGLPNARFPPGWLAETIEVPRWMDLWRP
jgi:hypothetical protein